MFPFLNDAFLSSIPKPKGRCCGSVGRGTESTGRERDAGRGRDGLCYNAEKRGSTELLRWEEYDKPTGQQSNEQRGGPVEEPRCSCSAPARVHLWGLSP